MEPGARLAQLIRDRSAAILARWEQQVRAKGIARALSRPALFDSMPKLVEHLAVAAETGRVPDTATFEQAALEHGQQRLELGYDLGQLLLEYGALRLALLDELHEAGGELPLVLWRPVMATIEAAVSEVTHRFTRARERKLRALERISDEVLRAPDLDAMLEQTVAMLHEAVPEVDEVTVLLREGHELRVRASRGLEGEMRRGFAVAIGTGFAGTVAATREPLLLHDPSTGPLVRSDVLRDLGLRALYGVPLVEGDEVIGVAHMGSRAAYDFQPEDLLLFRAMVNRVAAVVAGRRTAEREREVAELRDRFVGVLGHDLRSPLNAILGSAQLLLRRGHLEEPDRGAVDRIVRTGWRMERLIADVLDFTRARLGGGIPLTVAPADLRELARHACEEAQAGRPGRVVRLEVPTEPLRVPCDADRVEQVLGNLLANALQHGAPGAPVALSVGEAAPGQAVVLVHNEGSPIPPELLPHLFDPFRRGADTGGGLGLGLYIARAIVVAHGGSIEARSSAGEGTTFVVRLPARPAAPARGS